MRQLERLWSKVTNLQLEKDQVLQISPQKKQLCDVMEILANTMGIIILQYTNVSNQHVVHLEIKHNYMPIIAQLTFYFVLEYS